MDAPWYLNYEPYKRTVEALAQSMSDANICDIDSAMILASARLIYSDRKLLLFKQAKLHPDSELEQKPE